jgi:hypothetical protein
VPSSLAGLVMRLRRSRRRNLILLSTRAVPSAGVRETARLARRRRFRFMRTGALLAVISVMRLAQIACSHWRVSLGLCGVLLEVLGHSVFAGPARGVADLLGLTVVLFAVLKSEAPASDRSISLPQVAWRWHG